MPTGYYYQFITITIKNCRKRKRKRTMTNKHPNKRKNDRKYPTNLSKLHCKKHVQPKR